MKALRFAGDAEIRAQAVLSIISFSDANTAEDLIRSALEDSDEGVRQIARQALNDLLGKETARNAVDAFKKTDAEDEPWLIDEWEDEKSGSGGSEAWSTADIHGLIAVLTNEPKSEMRLKAIEVLKDLHNTRALEALATTALWDEDDKVKLAAREALEGIYGDQLAEVLEYFQSPEQEEEADEDEAEEEETDGQADSAPLWQGQIKIPPSPTIQEDNPGKRFLAILFILLIAAALVFFFVLRP